MGLVLLYTFKS